MIVFDNFYEPLTLPSGDRVLVAMSGGVDSTVAALLLHEAGCRITGVTMTMGTPSCGSPHAADEAREFCRRIGAAHIAVDVESAYRHNVIDYFTAAYRAGLTPNPCIECNRTVKFQAMLDAARENGAEWDYFCTGHYARVVREAAPYPDPSASGSASADTIGCFGQRPRNDCCLQGSCASSGATSSFVSVATQVAAKLDGVPPLSIERTVSPPALIATAADASKDQSYFLARIPNSTVQRVRFPLGSMTKAEVKSIARKLHLPQADQAESQDFLPPSERAALFAPPCPPGDIVDMTGRVLGRHNGLNLYTVGQRRALNVAAGYPLYVVRLDAAANTVVLGTGQDLMSPTLTATNVIWHTPIPREPIRAQVKVRSRTPAVPATVTADGGRATTKDDTETATGGTMKLSKTMTVNFDTPQRAIAPGQQAVVYVDGAVWAAGVIKRSDCTVPLFSNTRTSKIHH